MSSTTRSRSSSPSFASIKASASKLANDFRFDILEPNNILLADGVMDEERWSDLAFSLGLPARVGQISNTVTHRLAQKMKKHEVQSAAQTYTFIKPLIESLVTACPNLSQQNKCVYHKDAAPTVDLLKNTVHRLPTPTPVISVAYCRDAFTIAHDELQNGIIAGPFGEPCDLNRISQPVANHFWPFFIVEISETSLAAARQAAAVSAATCSNAVNLLAGAVSDSSKGWSSSSFDFDRKFTRSFSLSIHGRVATFNVHTSEAGAAHAATPIAVYRLDSNNDVASLASRIHSIMVWAQYNRLAEITAALDQLDKKVHCNLSSPILSSDMYDFDLRYLQKLKLQHSKRPDRVKVLLRTGLASWLT